MHLGFVDRCPLYLVSEFFSSFGIWRCNFICMRTHITIYTTCTRLLVVTGPPTSALWGTGLQPLLLFCTDNEACRGAVITLTVIAASNLLFCFSCILSQRVCNLWQIGVTSVSESCMGGMTQRWWSREHSTHIKKWKRKKVNLQTPMQTHANIL